MTIQTKLSKFLRDRFAWCSVADHRSLSPLRSQVENMLRQYRGQTVLYHPNPGTGGDSLLATGTYHAFARSGVEFKPIGLDANVEGRTVFLGGGGNFVPMYDHIRSAYEAFLGRAKQIILLPHTIRGNEDMLLRLNDRCVLFCRDQESFLHVRSANSSLNVVLGHDMAFHIDVRKLFGDRRLVTAGRRVLRDKLASVGLTENELRSWPSVDMLRTDAESAIGEPRTDVDISMLFMLGVWPHEAPLAAWCFLKAIRSADHINTDRLHVGIGAALLGVPCTLRDNSYGKNAAVYRHSLGSFPSLRFVSK